ncbi:MAG: hypothetical protein HKO13_03815 [Sphingomonas sp.]|nr:hypothetical protein [Sphingomonas sp.]RZV53467.1 MAG: hypothetical protein EX258_00310 [Sphingomonadaceae bacterium]
MMRGFGPILWTGGVLGAALSCYLVSLQVASERAELERIERDIAMVTRDIRELETEIGTRGRLSQLEKWNAGFLQLAAPEADQFLDGSFQLATLIKPRTNISPDAPVILASAPKPRADAANDRGIEDMVVQASLDDSELPPRPAKPSRVAEHVDPLAPLPTSKVDDGFDFITHGEDPTQP